MTRSEMQGVLCEKIKQSRWRKGQSYIDKFKIEETNIFLLWLQGQMSRVDKKLT